ncbi:MAG: efflux RND transporter permease subunit [Saprospiraceae bacterium]
MRVNPFQTLLIALALTVIGFALVPELILKYLPTEKKPALTVQAYWRSASPEAVEREITSPLEAALSLVGGIDKIRSVSREGLCTIYLDLEQSGDLDLLRFEVATRVRQVAAGLPSGVTYPTLALSTGDDDDEEQPVLVYSLSGNLPPSELYTYARDEILPQLALTPELQRIDLAGGNAREWVLTTRPELLRTYALTDQDLAQTIDRMSSQEELGFAVYNNRPYPIRLYAPDTLTPDHLLALPLLRRPGRSSIFPM